jgi:hypothetical protein
MPFLFNHKTFEYEDAQAWKQNMKILGLILLLPMEKGRMETRSIFTMRVYFGAVKSHA